MANVGRPTIIYVSASFVRRFKCPVSLSLDKPTQAQTMKSWSGDLLKVARAGEVAVMMQDASLAAIIVPLKGVRRFEEFLPVFLQSVAELWETLGATFDAANQEVLAVRRNNRRLIGSLNNAKQLIEFIVGDQLDNGKSVDWNEARLLINQTPFAVIGYESPLKRLEHLLRPV